MAIFPTGKLQMKYVCYMLGYLKARLSTLCRTDRLNIYSRYRPGYWYVDTSGKLAFQKPRGSAANDPRGSRFGKSEEAYSLGDFRGYNQDAASPSLNTGGDVYEVVFASDQGGKETQIEIVFNLGEVDWFDEETEFHGRNYINAGAYDYIYVEVEYSNGSKIIEGGCSKNDLERGERYARAPIPVSLYVPTSGTLEHTLRFALGTAGKGYAYFPNELTLRLKVLSGAVVIVRILADAITGLRNKLSLSPSNTGDSPSDAQEVRLYNNQNNYETAVTSATFSQLSMIVRMYSGNEYQINSLRLGISGTVYCYNKPYNESGAYIKSQKDFNMSIAANGAGIYTATFALPETANDQEYFYCDIKNFTDSVVNAKQI